MGLTDRIDASHAIRPLRILIVTPSVPWPPNWGFAIRVVEIIRYLSRTHRVSILCYAQPGDEAKVAALADLCHSVHTIPSPLPTNRVKRQAQLRSLFHRHSFQSSSLRTDSLRLAASGLLRGERFDLVQIESSQMSGLPAVEGVTYVLDEHNVEYELLQRMYQTERSLLRKFYNWREYQKFRREEWRSWREADGCVVTSKREYEILAHQEPAKSIHVAPNGVDTDFFAPSESPIETDSIVFTGLMNYRPNIDAAVFFVEQVLPLVRKHRPSVHFTVVGMGPSQEVLRLAGPNVRITGGVADVRPYLVTAGVVVVPLRMGSGTRLKVMEGLAMGKPMVSTALGCEGIEVRHGQHLLVANTAAAFAEAVLSLMDEPQTGIRLGRNGRRLVERMYSWETIVRGLEHFHARVINSVRRGDSRSPSLEQVRLEGDRVERT